MAIEINNLTDVEVDEVLVKKIVGIVLSGEGAEESADACPEPFDDAQGKLRRGVSIAFIGPGRMRKLNKTYRKKNKVTDVLSFSNAKVGFEKFKIGPTEKTDGLGEIVICLREVAKNAKKNDSTQERELIWVVIHGVLHLLGFDHEKSEAEAEKMERKQEQYLQELSK